MKKLTAVFVITTLLLNAMAPTLADAATYLQGAEINANALVQDAYVAVTYFDRDDKQKLTKGWIDAVGDTSFTIRSGGLKDKKTIAYDKVLSVVMSDESTVPAKQMNEVNRFIPNMKARVNKKKISKAEQDAIRWLRRGSTPIRFKTSSIAGDWMAGWLENTVGDTLIVSFGGDTNRIPLSSLSNLEVLVEYTNGGKYILVGLGLGAGIIAAYQISHTPSYTSFGEGYAGLIVMIAAASTFLIFTIIGAQKKTDKWVEVSPQSLNLSIAPTSTKGLRAALTFNF